MKERAGGHAASGIFVFLLLSVFAVFSTFLVLLCAQAYRSTVDETARHGEERVFSNFVRNALRSRDAQDDVDMAELDGVTALTVSGAENGDGRVRYIYCYDGALCDLFLDAGEAFAPEKGERICPAQDLSVSLSQRLITVVLTDEKGEEHSFFIARRSAW